MIPQPALQISGRLGDELGALPLTSVAIESVICDLLVTTTVRQTFRNTRPGALEATYVFPLPDRAGVTRFTARLGGRTIEAVLREREQANRDYEAAIAAGQRAAIAEEERSGVFTTRVGNLAPGEEAEVVLTLAGPVPVDGGEAEYRFPLVVAPRYAPGEPLPDAVGTGILPDTDLAPDASRISPPVLLPGQESPVALSLTARFLAASGIPPAAGTIRSSVHGVSSRQAGGETVVALLPGERLDRDVVLRWPLPAGGLATSAVLVPDADDRDAGTWLLTVVPPPPGPDSPPRDVVVALDRSGSMAGWKMVAARRAAARVVDSLGGRDRFAVIAFDNRVERPGPDTGLVPATDGNRWSAVEWLARLEARGGTEMLNALRAAAADLAPGDGEPRERFLVLVTDGQVANEDHILRSLAPLAGTCRISCLGIDRAVNAGFLRRLAALGGGRCDLVESAERLEEVMTTLHRRISPPVVRRLTVTASGVVLDGDTLTPERPPDVFPGSPCLVAGRWRREGAPGPATLHVAGEGIELSLEPRVTDLPAARVAWARAHVRDLEDRYAAAGSPGLATRIVATSLRFGVLSRFTAFVAVDPERVVVEGEPERLIQPVELPQGWAAAAEAPAPMMARVAPPARAQFGKGTPHLREEHMLRMLPADAGPAPAPAADLTSYRPRIEELLREVEELGAGGIDRVLADRVDELAVDLASTGAPDELVDALRALARSLRAGLEASALAHCWLALPWKPRPSRRTGWWRR